jgi:2-polyprenyl-6-hydroxyphenyl methylase/3-demethylubiquinone-9 3-methyltransferase
MIRRHVLDLSGVPIYYYRCPQCRFIFTTAFDHFTKEDFRRHIYNDEYHQVDPDYRQVRPQANASFLRRLFAGSQPERILEYGGGNGQLANLLLASGFAQVDTYDPFVLEHSARPEQRYDCIVSFEVAEHSTDPVHTISDMNELVADPGLILFSTLLQPSDIDQQQLSWWYAGPRNGHVSLYSRASLEALARRHGFTLGSFNDGLHVFYRDIPEFAKSFIQTA